MNPDMALGIGIGFWLWRTIDYFHRRHQVAKEGER